GLLGLDLFSPGGLLALPELESPISPVHAYRVKLHDIPFRDRAGPLAEATPLHLLLSAFGGRAGQTDLGDSSGDADREGLTHLDAGRHQGLSKVGVMGVVALHADTTLAVDRGGSRQGADDSGPGCSSRGDDVPEAPHGRLPVDAVVAVLALEEAAPEILSIAVLREAQALVVHGVDNEGIRCEAGDVLNR